MLLWFGFLFKRKKKYVFAPSVFKEVIGSTTEIKSEFYKFGYLDRITDEQTALLPTSKNYCILPIFLIAL